VTIFVSACLSSANQELENAWANSLGAALYSSGKPRFIHHTFHSVNLPYTT